MSPAGLAALVVYHPGCPFAIRLRLALTLHRVPYVAQRFRADEAVAGRVRAANGGNEISPSVLVGERWLTNPSWRAVAAACREA